MFGYIKVFENKLRVCDLKAYKGVYCGLCRRIACYSQLARMLLSFDMVFLAMLAEYRQNDYYLEKGKGHCLKRNRDAGDSMDFWACISIVMIYQKIQNDVSDGEIKKKVILKGLEPGYQRCKSRFEAEDELIRARLSAIDNLEKSLCDDPVKIADIFADMMVKVFCSCPGFEGNEIENRHLCNIVRELAVWVYLVDFYDDVAKDAETEQYNPLLIQAQKRKMQLDDILLEFRPTIDRQVEELQRLCDFLPYGGFQPVVSNVLHEGVIAVTAKVMMGEKK